MLTTEGATLTREQGETAERVAEDMADTLRAGIECPQTRARTLQDAVESSADAVSALSRRSPGQVMSGYGLADREAQGLIEEASRNLRAVAQSNAALARAFQDVSREWLRQSQRRLLRNLDGLNALARCRSATEFLAIQSCLVLNNLEQSIETSRRFAEIAIRMTADAKTTITDQAEKTTVLVEKTVQRVSCMA